MVYKPTLAEPCFTTLAEGLEVVASNLEDWVVVEAQTTAHQQAEPPIQVEAELVLLTTLRTAVLEL
jgi:hypothetical protein